MITNYSTLQSAIADWLNRQDLTAQIPTFIQFCEADLNNRLRCREQIVRAEATSNNEFVQLPSDWVEAINLQIVDGQNPLRYVTLDEADIIKHEHRYQRVHAYSLMNGAIELVPEPSDNVDIEMVYYRNIPALSDTNTSNWLLARAPDVYLYGALTHAAPFLLDDQRIQVFGGIYAGRVSALNEEAQKSMHSGSPLIARTRRVY